MKIPDPISWILGRISIILNDCQWNEIYKTYRAIYNIPKSFTFNGHGIVFYGGGLILCGENSYIGRYSSIQSGPEMKVVIGNNVSISHHVKIYTVNRVADADYSLNKDLSCGDVIIGDYCWIGSGVFIKENVIIGENTAIGANSVVTKNIPSNCIAAGNPAKVIKMKSYISE